MKITVGEIKSILGFGIKLSNGWVLYLLSKISVYADSGNSVSYCLFTLLKNNKVKG